MLVRSGYRSTVSAPIIVAGTLWGAVSIGSAEPLPPTAEVRLAAFCDLVSLAVASAQAREDLQTSRARIVRAGDEQRRRLERNLHDGAQQRLVAATLLLRLAQTRLEADPSAAAALLQEAGGELDAGLEELRELARGLHPGALMEHGLRGALMLFEERLPLPVEIEVPSERLDRHVEATAYFIVSEGLTNVVKHAGASRASREGGDEGRCAPARDHRRRQRRSGHVEGNRACSAYATAPRRRAARSSSSARRAAAR